MQRCNVEAAPSVQENRSLKRTGKASFCSRSTFGRRGLQAADERVAAEQYAAPYLDSGLGRSKRLRTDVGVGGMKVRLRASGVHCALIMYRVQVPKRPRPGQRAPARSSPVVPL